MAASSHFPLGGSWHCEVHLGCITGKADLEGYHQPMVRWHARHGFSQDGAIESAAKASAQVEWHVKSRFERLHAPGLVDFLSVLANTVSTSPSCTHSQLEMWNSLFCICESCLGHWPFRLAYLQKEHSSLKWTSGHCFIISHSHISRKLNCKSMSSFIE